MVTRKKAIVAIAIATSDPKIPRKMVNLPSIVVSTTMQNKSIIQARNREIGPARSRGKEIPSGVRITSRFASILVNIGGAFRSQTGSKQEREEQNKFDASKRDLNGIGDDRLMILGKKRLDKAGPDQEQCHASNQCKQVVADQAEASPDGISCSPTNQGASQYE